MEATEILRKALQAVDDAEVPEDLRELAFAKAVDLYAGTDRPSIRRRAGGRPEEEPSPPPAHDDEELSPGLRKVRDFYGMSDDQLTDWFEEDESGEIHLLHAPENLANDNANLVRVTCLLLGCARKVGGYDDSVTHYETFRSAIDDMGLYDSGNFSKQVAKMTEWFTVNGKSTKMSFRLKPGGRAIAKEKLRELLVE